MKEQQLTRPGTWNPGDRVFVENEGPATVVLDEGYGRGPGRNRWLDSGVVVKIDSDGVEVSASHDMLKRL